MFFVYGVGGQIYSGGYGNLQQVAPVRRVPRTRALHGADTARPQTNAQGPDDLLVPPPDARDGDSGGARPRLRPLPGALSAYGAPDAPARRHQLTCAEAVMTRKRLLLIPETTDAATAWRLLAERGVAQAPVLRGETLVGMLLRADLMTPPPEAAALPAPRTVADRMLTPVPAVAPNTALRHVARALLDTGLSGLPVTDAQGKVQGIVSRTDILRAVAAEPPLDLWS